MNEFPLEDSDSDLLLEHFESPYHKGRLDRPTCTCAIRNPLSGDLVQLELRIAPSGRIEQAYFDGQGCVISQAAASILCEHIEGKPVAEIKALEPARLLDLLKVPLSPARKRCALLGFTALKTMLYALEPTGEPAEFPHAT